MSKCKICHTAYVDYEGYVCDTCRKCNSEQIISDLPSKHRSYKTSQKDLYEGVVRYYRQYDDQQSFWIKFFKSLILSSQFNVSNHVSSFQLYENQNYVKNTKLENACKEVIVNGAILSGFLNDNNTVRVIGKMNRKGSIIATDVINVSSGSKIKRRGIYSANAVRIATLTFAVPLIILFNILSNSMPTEWTFLIIFMLLIWFKFFRFRRKR